MSFKAFALIEVLSHVENLSCVPGDPSQNALVVNGILECILVVDALLVGRLLLVLVDLLDQGALLVHAARSGGLESIGHRCAHVVTEGQPLVAVGRHG